MKRKIEILTKNNEIIIKSGREKRVFGNYQHPLLSKKYDVGVIGVDPISQRSVYSFQFLLEFVMEDLMKYEDYVISCYEKQEEINSLEEELYNSEEEIFEERELEIESEIEELKENISELETEIDDFDFPEELSEQIILLSEVGKEDFCRVHVLNMFKDSLNNPNHPILVDMFYDLK